MKKLLILLVLFFALLISSSFAAITGCTEIAGGITECTGALSGTTLDTSNTSIWIHDATHTSGLIRLNTTLVNGYINISNFTVTSASTVGYWYSEDIYINHLTYAATGGTGSTGSTGYNNDAGGSAGDGGPGEAGGTSYLTINSTINSVNNLTVSVYGGTGGTGGTGGSCSQNSCTAGGGGTGGNGGAVKLIIHSIDTLDFLNNTEIYIKGGTGGKGGTTGNCQRGGGGWSPDYCRATGTGGIGGSTIITVSGEDMRLKEGWSKFTSTGGATGNFDCSGCQYNSGYGPVGGVGTSTVIYNIFQQIGFDTFNLSYYNPSSSILNFTNEDEVKIGFFNTSEILYATDIYCTASNIIYGNDSTVTAPDAELDWTNCPAYADGNITYLTYEEFFGELRNFNLSINNTVVYETAGLTGPTEVDINITVVNNFLDNCTADANGLCDMPISSFASNDGTLNISNVVLEIEDYSNLTCNFYLNDTINSTQELQYNETIFNTTSTSALENNLDYDWQQTCYSKGTNYAGEEFNHSGIVKVGDINPVTWDVVNNSQISPDITIVGLFNDTRGDPVATHNFSLNVTDTNGVTEYTIETNSTGGFTKQLSLLPGFNNISYFIKLGTQSWEDIGLFEVFVFNQSTVLNSPSNNSYFYYNNENETYSEVVTNYTWTNKDLVVNDLNCMLYIDDIYNLSESFSPPDNSTTSTFIKNFTEGVYNLGVACNDTTNSVLTLSNISKITVTGTSILLDDINLNRTYEYGSIANVTIIANDSLNTCADVYILGYGIDYVCDTDSPFSFSINLSDYIALDYFTDGISSLLHYFRVKTYSLFNATMPNYIDVLEASLDLTGNYSESSITYFDDWATNDTSKEYIFTSNENTLLNMSFRSVKILQSAYFSVYSTEASILYIDICNDGTVDTTATSTFFSTTPIQLDIDAINDCTNESLDISVVPFALNFTTGGNVTISVVDFVLSEQVYPEDITLDVNNDELVDFSLPGELVGQLGAVSTFSDGDTSKDFSSNTSTVESFMFNISVPRNLQYTTYTIALSSISDTDLFDEDFKDNDYINTSTTTANVETFWGQVKNGLSAGSPTESWIYSKEIPSYVTNITSITNIVSTDEDNTNAATYFWLSSNNGTNWTEMEENDDTTIAVPGDHVYWKARLTTDTLAYAYIYNLELTGLGYAPTNLSIDVGNDGSLDWNITGRYSGDLTDIVLDSDTIEAAISGCNTTLCTVQNNFTFTGVAELRLSLMNVVYSTDDVNIPTEVLNAYLNNEKTNRVLVTNFNDSETYKLFNTSTIAYIDIPDDVIVDTANITIVGGYS